MKFAVSVFALLGIALLAGCQPTQPSEPTLPHQPSVVVKNDTQAFKTEYESLNTEKMPITVPEDLNISVLDFSGTKEFLEKGTGILYFGFPTCPWCRALLPNLFDAMKKSQISDLYYYNPREIRDQKSLGADGKIVVEKETSPEYQYLLDKLDSVLPVYEGLKDPSIKRLYVPFVVVLKEGKIVGSHLNTLDEQEDPSVPLTDEQKAKLVELLEQAMAPLASQTCTPGEIAC